MSTAAERAHALVKQAIETDELVPRLSKIKSDEKISFDPAATCPFGTSIAAKVGATVRQVWS
jgi:hypothetical protein